MASEIQAMPNRSILFIILGFFFITAGFLLVAFSGTGNQETGVFIFPFFFTVTGLVPTLMLITSMVAFVLIFVFVFPKLLVKSISSTHFECPNCGAPTPIYAHFCPICGLELQLVDEHSQNFDSI